MLDIPDSALVATTAASSHARATEGGLFAAVGVFHIGGIEFVFVENHFRLGENALLPGLHWLNQGTGADARGHHGENQGFAHHWQG